MSLKYNILIGGYFYNGAPIDIKSKEIKTSLGRKNITFIGLGYGPC